jgi:hypothetical protein
MMLKREAPHKPSNATRWLRSVGAGVLATAASLALAAGCLQRPVQPQDPNTSNLFVDQIVQTAVDKIDLLFMIDNSRSMADKQKILGEAVPVLVQRLVTPACVNRDGDPTGQNVNNGRCPTGSEPEFAAIRDIHIGIVTSSLGDMGSGDACTPGAAILDDKGQMLGTPGLRTMALSNWNGQGFLAWDPDAAMNRPRNNPPGTTDAAELIGDFTDMVLAAGEQGCGYEASLEAWYRFLIDPEPPGLVTKMPVGGADLTVAGPADATILAQRAAFLRPDSLVAIVMLTDENDCSIIDYGQGWIVGLQQGGSFYMPRATAACGTDPNGQCCFSCSLNAANVPQGCTPPGSDPECAKGQLSMAEDHPNLRCFQQKRRFGFDLLHPVGKYIQGLTQPMIYNPRKGDINGDGKFFQPDDTVPNPLFVASTDGKRRDRSLVFLAGIVGVPWQDISDKESWATNDRRLKYLSYTELVTEGRWDWILGPSGGPPQDGLMFETDKDRTTFSNVPQAHPAGANVGGSIVASTATQNSNPINGHESAITDGSDLQFSCIFPLNTSVNCDQAEVCDCKEDDEMYNRSLCMGHTQTHAKAFPGTRHLEVLKGVGDVTGNAIVASICPKNSMAQGSASGDPNYGYNPAVAAIIDRLKDALKGKCLPRTLSTDDQGKIPCVVVEARLPAAGGACEPCGGAATPDRTATAGNIDPVVRDKLADSGFCGGNTNTDCNSYCLCQVEQYQGADLTSCQTGPAEPVSPKGYCYVDGNAAPGEDPNSPDLAARKAIVAKCPASQQRLLRFATEVPAKGAVAFIACIGDSLSRPTATMLP